jgi:hypothetical protein
MTVRKQLFYGSLQDHNRASRKEMNQSYVNQQNQLMSMNVVREAQRLQLSQAETLVKLNQLKDDLTRARRLTNAEVIPNSNSALESTLDPDVVESGDLEEKRPAPSSSDEAAELETTKEDYNLTKRGMLDYATLHPWIKTDKEYIKLAGARPRTQDKYDIGTMQINAYMGRFFTS